MSYNRYPPEWGCGTWLVALIVLWIFVGVFIYLLFS